MPAQPANPERRQFIAAVGGAAALATTGCASLPAPPEDQRVVNDVSQLNPVPVAWVRRPRSTDEVRATLRAWPGAVSVGGGHFSMGGQVAAPDSLHLDTRAMNQVLAFDAERRVIRAQSGATWRDLQDMIDPLDLSIRVMQSYSNFTLGGSLSVNCHGRYVGKGPVVNAVRAVQIVTADGDVLELSRARDAELFRAVIGGYGGLGVVTEVELDLESNSRLERQVRRVPLEQYPEFFHNSVVADPAAVLHNADLAPPHFDAPWAITWVRTEKPVTESARLTPRGLDYTTEKNVIWIFSELPGTGPLRAALERHELEKPLVVWRNHEASLDAASLEPRSRAISTYLLQEYFIPIAQFASFAHAMGRILQKHNVNTLNVSIRHTPADDTTLMRWAATDVFSFVLFYKQRHTDEASAEVAVWTRELIDAALATGGRYYLPYRLDATPAQFHAAFPEAPRFAALKRRVDPRNRMRNLLWDKYLST